MRPARSTVEPARTLGLETFSIPSFIESKVVPIISFMVLSSFLLPNSEACNYASDYKSSVFTIDLYVKHEYVPTVPIAKKDKSSHWWCATYVKQAHVSLNSLF
ncbi:hypothetical protein VCRA2121O157_250023 [Vibrio crassostreae]|nr:hypothetical protein VCRA2113O137_210051 [Vibrio crassostreae]CAK1939810.1 hypothetical protein VCRA2113O140_250023 [Vibrio crassostreae]CAK1940083.1 hypothetical protein VCRA2113O138_250071 [Vibrio crassostreae]CAK2282064.1 hypothetical protein VCRA2116O141_180072 [Vibrio crassostreae]CAK2527982.1 hypothetical protein VCRA2113O415_680004 [Vibrio crassostreae]